MNGRPQAKKLVSVSEILEDEFKSQRLRTNFSPKILQAVFTNAIDAQLLQAVVYWYNTFEKSGVEHDDGWLYIPCTRAQLARWLAVPKSTLFGKDGPVERLTALRLIHMLPFLNTTLWRPDMDRIALFMLMALVLYTSRTALEWDEWLRNSGLVEAFKRKGESVFPGYQNKNKPFSSRTPYSRLNKDEERLRDNLLKKFREWDQKALSELCFGTKQSSKLVGIHTSIPGRIPYHSRSVSIPPLDGFRITPGMESVPPDTHDSHDPPMKTTTVEYNTGIRSDTRNNMLSHKDLRSASTMNDFGPTSFQWDGFTHMFPKAVKEIVKLIFGENAVKEHLEEIQSIASALCDEYEENHTEECIFSDQHDFLLNWGKYVRKYKDDIKKLKHLYPYRQYKVWREFEDQFYVKNEQYADEDYGHDQ